MNDNRSEKIELLELLEHSDSEPKTSHGYSENSVIRRVLSEERWCLLSNKEKQSKRNASISLGKKWSLDAEKLEYAEFVVSVYDLITNTLEKIDSIDSELDYDLLRMKAFFLIERDFIDEKKGFEKDRHLPAVFFKHFSIELEEKYPFLELENFYKIYLIMVEKWPNRPV